MNITISYLDSIHNTQASLKEITKKYNLSENLWGNTTAINANWVQLKTSDKSLVLEEGCEENGRGREKRKRGRIGEVCEK